MKLTPLTILLLCCLFSQFAEGQTVSLGGEFRINPVYSRGFREPLYEGDKPGLYTMQRTRFILNYEKENDLRSEIIVQDRRFWGEESDRADVAHMAVFRAWVEKSFTPELSLRLGRQGFIYDDQHLLGDPNWVGTRAHDAGLLKYEKEGLKAHLAFAYNANGQELKRSVYEYNQYKNLQFLWLEKSFGPHAITLTAINRGMERGNMSSAYTQTFGPFARFKISDRLSVKGMYYHQVGETEDGKKVNASFYSGVLTFNASKNLQLVVGVDAGSGTDQADRENPDYDKSHSFDRLSGLLHGHFGYIDYFYVLNPTPYGVRDHYVKAKVNVTDRFSIDNHLHAFAATSDINNPNREGDVMPAQLGVENDILLTYRFAPAFKATLAHSIMFGTPTLDQVFGGQESVESQMFYAVITASLDFFKSTPDNR